MSNFQTAVHIHSGHQPYPPSVCTARDGEKSCVYRVTIASTSIFYPTLPPLESTECAFKLWLNICFFFSFVFVFSALTKSYSCQNCKRPTTSVITVSGYWRKTVSLSWQWWRCQIWVSRQVLIFNTYSGARLELKWGQKDKDKPKIDKTKVYNKTVRQTILFFIRPDSAGLIASGFQSRSLNL